MPIIVLEHIVNSIFTGVKDFVDLDVFASHDGIKSVEFHNDTSLSAV